MIDLTGIYRSEVVPTSNNESKGRKAELDHLNEGLTRTRIETSDKLSSMESTVGSLHDRVDQIDNRLDKVCINALFTEHYCLSVYLGDRCT